MIEAEKEESNGSGDLGRRGKVSLTSLSLSTVCLAAGKIDKKWEKDNFIMCNLYVYISVMLILDKWKVKLVYFVGEN